MTKLKQALLLVTTLMLSVFLMGTTAQAQTTHSLAGGSGGQAQIGSGLPLPIQIFTLGTTVGQAGSYPPLLIPPHPGAVGATPTKPIIQQANGAITVPTAALSRPALTILKAPTFPTNPSVFQVNTALDYAWPAASATFAPGGGPAGATGVFNGGPTGVAGVVTYTNAGAAFGGSGLFSLGPNAGLVGGGAIVGQAVTVYINFMAQAPGGPITAAIVGANPVAPQYGVTTAALPASTPGIAASPGFMMGLAGPAGTISTGSASYVQFGTAGLTNMVTSDQGFPWTTGFITVSQPNAVPPEVFYLSGTDTRGAKPGFGNISMVSSTLSTRALSGPNSNRSWVSLTLPEPTAMAGAAGALFMLGACHSLIRRRR